MEEDLIAPCGMNCAICMAYLREKNNCPGCHKVDAYAKSSRLGCIIRNCPTISGNRSGFCHECPTFPCRRLKQLDKRYATKYHMSMIENLEKIRDEGMASFLEWQVEKWRCPECGGVISCHNGICYSCGLDKLSEKRHKLGWDDE